MHTGLAVAISLARQRRCRSRFVQWSRVYFRTRAVRGWCAGVILQRDGIILRQVLEAWRVLCHQVRSSSLRSAFLAWATLSSRTSHQRRWVHISLQSGAFDWSAHALAPGTSWLCSCGQRRTPCGRVRSLAVLGERCFVALAGGNRRSLPSIHDACRVVFMRRCLTFWRSVLPDCVELAFWRDGIHRRFRASACRVFLSVLAQATERRREFEREISPLGSMSRLRRVAQVSVPGDSSVIGGAKVRRPATRRGASPVAPSEHRI